MAGNVEIKFPLTFGSGGEEGNVKNDGVEWIAFGDCWTEETLAMSVSIGMRGWYEGRLIIIDRKIEMTILIWNGKGEIIFIPHIPLILTHHPINFKRLKFESITMKKPQESPRLLK